MSDEVPSARPVPVPTPVEPAQAPPEAVSLPEPAVVPPPDPLSQKAAIVHVALLDAEDAVSRLHASAEVQQQTANPERVASALVLLNQARTRFEEWLSQF